jgi:hypothetical protein
MGRDAQVIRHRNEQAREALADDLHALSEKLDVKKQVARKKTDIVDNIKGKMGMDTTHNGNGHSTSVGSKSEANAILDAIKEHPVAAAALTIGTRTLVKSWLSHHHEVQHGTVQPVAAYPTPGTTVSSSQGSSLGDKASSAKDAVTDTASDVKDKAMDVGGTIADSVSSGTDMVAAKVGDARTKAAEVLPTTRPEIESTVRDNLPLFGIAALALGAMAGMLAPRTKLEDERLGELSDKLVDTVQEKAVEVKDAVQHGASDAIDSAKEDLKSAAKEGMETAKSDLQPEQADDATFVPTTGSTKRPGMITGSKVPDSTLGEPVGSTPSPKLPM